MSLDRKVSRLLHYAITTMDEKGRRIPGNSQALFDDHWDDVRSNIFKALELLNVNKEPASLLANPVFLYKKPIRPIKPNKPPSIKNH